MSGLWQKISYKKVLVTHEIIENLLTDEVSDEEDGEFLTFNKTKIY